MATVNASITGMADIDQALDRLVIERDTAKRALMAGAQVLLPKLTDAAPVRTGTMKKSIKIGKFGVKGDGTVTLTVGSDHKDAPHAHLVERGHGGSRPAPAHPFMRPTYDANAEAVNAAVMDVLNKELMG